MAKDVIRRAERRAAGRALATRRSRAGWVRKNVAMDQRKLDAARRALGAVTETEAIDRALDLVAFRRDVARGIAAVRRAGGVAEIVGRRRRV